MKKLVLLIPLVFILVIVIGLFWIFNTVKPVSSNANFVNFNVPVGASATQIGSSLYKQGLIKNASVFKIYVQFSGIAANIQAGDYKLSQSYSLFQITDALSKVPPAIKVTIPEGFTNSEIAAKFAKNLDQGQTFITEFLNMSKNDEGYLFPDTYLVASNASASAIVAKMKLEFETKTKNLKPTKNQIILASIIERETKGEEERPVVAGILMNRLNIGMALQVDVAPDTYKTVGLPASPISNPGLVSIKAAINPEKTDFLYYLHDPTGQIHYAKTLDDHNANIKKYLQ